MSAHSEWLKVFTPARAAYDAALEAAGDNAEAAAAARVVYREATSDARRIYQAARKVEKAAKEKAAAKAERAEKAGVANRTPAKVKRTRAAAKAA